MFPFRPILCILIPIILAGCTSQSTVMRIPATSTVKPIPTFAAIPTPVQINLSPLTVVQAWGNVQSVRHTRIFGDFRFTPGGRYPQNSITDDDQICGAISPTTYNPAFMRYSLGLFDLHTGKLTTLQILADGYAMVSCSVTGPWIVWSQSTENDVDWQVRAFNRQTQEIRTLDMSHGKVSGIPSPSSGHGIAAWTTLINDQGGVAAVIYDFTTGQKMQQPNGTLFPLISWPWLFWGDSVQRAFVFHNMETQQQVVITKGTSPTTTSFNATAMVESNAGYSAIRLYPFIGPDMLTGSYVVGKGINYDFVEFPSLNDRLVTWASNHSLFAFDRKLLRPIQILDNLNGNSAPFISSHYMIWGERDAIDENKSYINVLDTNTLP